MTEDKARKRATRKRMAKTGERYTAARRHLAPTPEPVADLPVSDASVRRGTGKGWDEWFRILDRWGGTSRTHTEIVRYLNEEQGVSSWWSQSVRLGYERARGMRVPHQTTKGFQVSVSKTLPVDVDRLFKAFADGRRRGRWLESGTLKVRTTRPEKSARFDFRDGPSRVEAYFTDKGASKSTVTVMHVLLPDREAVEEMRAFWKERLARLAEAM
jgi:uncharacterized protein YndB with AHSA1/START domain